MKEQKTDITSYSDIFKALSHPMRLKIVCGLVKKEECCVNNMAQNLGAPQPTVSQHLCILKNAGVIEGSRKANTICYKVTNKEVIKIIKSMDIDACCSAQK